MARTPRKLGYLLIAGAIAVYIAVLMAQGRAAAKLCDSYPAGSRIEDVENIEGTYLLTRMGPFEDPENPGTGKVIFCASLTMCDTSCSIELEDRVVRSATFTDH
ncbi:MAG: hypothetical protein R3245_09670 [Kiloniellales bacterium]|nr:hypothetical protein [Kiloniellales bacterium]